MNIDLGQPGIGMLLGFRVIDDEAQIIGKVTLTIGEGHSMPPIEFGRDYAIVDVTPTAARLPNQPAAYPGGAAAPPPAPPAPRNVLITEGSQRVRPAST